MSTWFRRIKKGISTTTQEKKEAPDGLWQKCPNCKHTTTVKDLEDMLYVCPQCQYHHRINAKEYFSLLFDEGEWTVLFDETNRIDKHQFAYVKHYQQRIDQAQAATKLKDAMTVEVGKLERNDFVIACMNFNFIGGSMGSVVGEKISRAIDYAIENNFPLMIISK